LTDTVLTLGDFRFVRFEIPESIPFGGDQKLIVHELVGGRRVIDAMGDAPLALEWSGYLVGASALPRALYLDGLRKAGKPLALRWSELSYTVLVKSFRPNYHLGYRIPYQITCEVVTDETAPVTTITTSSYEQAVADDAAAASALAAQVGHSGLTKAVSAITTALGKINKLAAAAQSEIAKVLQPIADARAQVAILLQQTGATLQSVGTLGGLVPGSPIAGQIANLTGQIGAIADQPRLLLLDRTLGRMSTNLGQINSGVRTLTTGGGNLFTLAANEYGDAMGWTAIAAANKLSDPEITGVATLVVPQFTNNTGGVLGG